MYGHTQAQILRIERDGSPLFAARPNVMVSVGLFGRCQIRWASSLVTLMGC